MSKKRRRIDAGGDDGGDAGANEGEVQMRPATDLSESAEVVAAAEEAAAGDRAARKRARRLAKAAASAIEGEEEAEQAVKETSKKKRKQIQRLEDTANGDEDLATGAALPKDTTSMEKKERKGGKRRLGKKVQEEVEAADPGKPEVATIDSSSCLATSTDELVVKKKKKKRDKMAAHQEAGDQQEHGAPQDVDDRAETDLPLGIEEVDDRAETDFPLGSQEADRPRPKKKKKKTNTAEDASGVVEQERDLVLGEDKPISKDPDANTSGKDSVVNEAKTSTREVAETGPCKAAKVGAGVGSEATDGDGCLKVCAARLPTSLDKAAIWRHFEKCGRISDVFVLMDWYSWKSKGVSFITFEDDQGVKAALALDGSEFHGNNIRVNLAVDKAKDEGKGGKSKGKGKGKISAGTGGKGKYYADGGSGGYAYGGSKGGKASSSSSAAAPMAVQDVPEPESGCPGVIVKGLAFAASEDDIRAHFAKCGKGPTSVRLMKDKHTGESKGKAFIDFEGDLLGSQAAMRMSGVFLKGRRMTVDYVRARRSADESGGKE